MRTDGPAWDDLRCIELVELLTAYLDDELADDQRERVDAHLAGCRGCSAALDQLRTLIRIAAASRRRTSPASIRCNATA